MSGYLDIQELIDRLLSGGISPEELICKTTWNLYRVETYFKSPKCRDIRNSVRASIAYAKMLYDFGQKMYFARDYLLQKIKLLEVREADFKLEVSELRGISPGKILTTHPITW